mgnify:CR=1
MRFPGTSIVLESPAHAEYRIVCSVYTNAVCEHAILTSFMMYSNTKDVVIRLGDYDY